MFIREHTGVLLLTYYVRSTTIRWYTHSTMEDTQTHTEYILVPRESGSTYAAWILCYNLVNIDPLPSGQAYHLPTKAC